jgi:hypothetical protein
LNGCQLFTRQGFDLGVPELSIFFHSRKSILIFIQETISRRDEPLLF